MRPRRSIHCTPFRRAPPRTYLITTGAFGGERLCCLEAAEASTNDREVNNGNASMALDTLAPAVAYEDASREAAAEAVARAQEVTEVMANEYGNFAISGAFGAMRTASEFIGCKVVTEVRAAAGREERPSPVASGAAAGAEAHDDTKAKPGRKARAAQVTPTRSGMPFWPW